MNLEFSKTEIPDCYLFNKKPFVDIRGNFFKMYEKKQFAQVLPENIQFSEVFFSTSVKNVVRGLHFQIPPQDHLKIVTCLTGKILDVILDLRKGSPTYQKAIGVELSGENGGAVVIPRGCAHGFYTLEEQSLVAYLVETSHDPVCDKGLLWSSIDFQWPSQTPIMSQRDLQFPLMKDFESPFVYKGSQ